MSEDRDDGAYLYVVDYEEDAERKRAEYLFDNWDRGTVRRPDGLVRIADDADHDELYRQLVAKVPEDQVDSYRIEHADTDVEPESVAVEESVDASREAVETFLEYILSKKKAVLQSAAHNEYEVYTKKGRADVSYELHENDEITVRVRVVGYSPAPAFLAEFFETELADYAASQSPE